MHTQKQKRDSRDEALPIARWQLFRQPFIWQPPVMRKLQEVC